MIIGFHFLIGTPIGKIFAVGHLLLLFGVVIARITLDLPFIAIYRNNITLLFSALICVPQR